MQPNIQTNCKIDFQKPAKNDKYDTICEGMAG